MTITTNATGTRSIEITEEHLDTINRYQFFRNLIDSNGIVDESTLEKLRLNVRSLLETNGAEDKALMNLCFDVIYHPNMKAAGLRNLLILYADNVNDNSDGNKE